ncbi:MAG: hypothetical protein ACFCBW_22290 [Candidatus Competibacterales bacterium]
MEHKGAGRFFASHRWPLAAILACVAFSVVAFTPRFMEYLSVGTWGQSATRAFEFAPRALEAHALLGMALIPLLFLQPLLGAALMGQAASATPRLAHRWHGWFLVLATGLLSAVGFYITYTFGVNSDSVTSLVFMFLVALFVILFFAQAVWEARKRQIERHLDALVFAMIFLSLPATGRLIEAIMGAVGVENTRSRDLVSIGLDLQVELVDITILTVSAVPLLLWGIYAIPRSILRVHPAKLWIATAFFGLPFLAVTAQTVTR